MAGLCLPGAGVAAAATVAPADGATTSMTTLSLSAATIGYGSEQAEEFTATVSGNGGTPTGTVGVTDGTTTYCTISLVSGTGASAGDGTGDCFLTADQIPVGPVLLTAAYVGDGTFAASSSAPAVSLQVDAPPPATPPTTTTRLTLARHDISYGSEQAERLSVTVTTPGGGTPPTGLVAIRARGATICAISLSASGTGACALRAGTLAPGTVRLTAAYAGDPAFGSSVSAAQSVAVAKERTVTSLFLSTARVSYGAEQHERISVRVEPASGGTATGLVTLRAGGRTVRVIALRAGRGRYTLPAARLAGGTARLSASYAADADHARSASAVKKLIVARAASGTTLSVSAAAASYGAEQRVRLAVRVRPAHGGAPTGRVTLRAGGARVCAIALRSGRGSCSPAASRLTPGRYRLAARFGGSGDVSGSVSATRILSVIRASSRTVLALSAGSVRYGREGSERIAVRVAPRYAGTPGGTVTVTAGGTTLAVLSLRYGRGGFALSAKELAAGSYTLRAVYRGSADFAVSASAGRSLRVTSPPPPPPAPPACHPRASSGNCYEPGEYCPDADHGEHGIDGEGNAIVCEDNNGWRWEAVSSMARSAPRSVVYSAFMFSFLDRQN